MFTGDDALDYLSAMHRIRLASLDQSSMTGALGNMSGDIACDILYDRWMLNPMDLGGTFAFADTGRVVPVTEARDKLTELIATTKQGQFPVIGRYREPGAVLVAPELVRLLPALLSAMARQVGDHVTRRRLDDIDSTVYLLGDPWPFVARALWLNGHRAMFAQFASDTLATIQIKDKSNRLPIMTVDEFLQAMPMTLGGDLLDGEREAAITLLQERLPSMNQAR